MKSLRFGLPIAVSFTIVTASAAGCAAPTSDADEAANMQESALADAPTANSCLRTPTHSAISPTSDGASTTQGTFTAPSGCANVNIAADTDNVGYVEEFLVAAPALKPSSEVECVGTKIDVTLFERAPSGLYTQRTKSSLSGAWQNNRCSFGIPGPNGVRTFWVSPGLKQNTKYTLSLRGSRPNAASSTGRELISVCAGRTRDIADRPCPKDGA